MKFLLLDEASSALDEETERGIMDHLRSIAGDVTILAITHHRGIIRKQDNVLHLEKNILTSDIKSAVV